MEFRYRLLRGIWPALARLAVVAAALFAVSGGAGAAELSAVRFGAATQSATRVVLDLTGPVDYALFGDGEGSGRLIIEFKGLSTAGVADAGEGHISRYAFTPVGQGSARAIFDFHRTARIKEHFVLPPTKDVKMYRLVIDLVTADKAAFLASLPPRYEDMTAILEETTQPAPAPAPALVVAPEPIAPAPHPIIVIDAGHGGSDPGAHGPDGVIEKMVTLAAAKRLQELLEAKGGYKVVMTRANDTRLGLDERSRAARDAGAELFISLHADAIADKKVRGASVYTLSEEGGARSAREVRLQGDYHVWNENISAREPVLSGILLDKAQDYTKTNSSKFADILIERLKDVTPLINNTHRTGDLYVLLAPDVPAVLLELGFISNRADESNLNSPAWRDKAMTGVADAIEHYFETNARMRHAANGDKRVQ